MKNLFDDVSSATSKLTTETYSTSFSLGIKFLSRKFHRPIYSIYGFVRFADEIVDSFHEYDKRQLLLKFKNDTYEAIESGISLNPIINSFQRVVREYNIEMELIDTFLDSMEMDLNQSVYDQQNYEKYILGSAEVVGLMCLRVFCERNEEQFESLKYSAMKLGSAFQKINFLRDIRADKYELGRTYFPEVNFESFKDENKLAIQKQIEDELNEGLNGIRRLPRSSRAGVFLAYYYFMALFKKIKALPASRIAQERIRVSNPRKIGLLINSMIKHQLNLI